MSSGGAGGGVKKRGSPDSSSPAVGISALLHTQNAPVEQDKIYQTDFISEHQPKYFIGISFAGNALKLEKVDPTFPSFNPCPSLPSVCTIRQKTVSVL